MSDTTPSPAEVDAASTAIETDERLSPQGGDLPLADEDVNEGSADGTTAPGAPVEGDVELS